MTGERKLFAERRGCVACDRSATRGKRVNGEPNILAVSMTLYRKGAGKGQLEAAGKVQICEECFVKALAPSVFGASTQARKMLSAMRDRLSARYSAMLEGESK